MSEMRAGRMSYGLDDQLYLQHYVVAAIAALYHHTGERALITHMDTTRIIKPASEFQYVDLQRYEECTDYGDTFGKGLTKINWKCTKFGCIKIVFYFQLSFLIFEESTVIFVVTSQSRKCFV